MITRILGWLGKLPPWEGEAHGSEAIDRSIHAEEIAAKIEHRAHAVAARMERETGHFWRDALKGARDETETS